MDNELDRLALLLGELIEKYGDKLDLEKLDSVDRPKIEKPTDKK